MSSHFWSGVHPGGEISLENHSEAAHKENLKDLILIFTTRMEKQKNKHPPKRPGMNYLMKSWFLLQFQEDYGCGKVFHGRSSGNERYFSKRLSNKSPFKGREIHLEKRGFREKYFCGTSAFFPKMTTGEKTGKVRSREGSFSQESQKGGEGNSGAAGNLVKKGLGAGKKELID